VRGPDSRARIRDYILVPCTLSTDRIGTLCGTLEYVLVPIREANRARGPRHRRPLPRSAAQNAPDIGLA